MKVVKPVRSPDAAKTWGAQEGGDFTLPRTFVDHFGNLVWMAPQFFYNSPAPEAAAVYVRRPGRINRSRPSVESDFLNRVLVEEAKNNYFHHSEDLGNAFWLKSQLSSATDADMGPVVGSAVPSYVKMTRLLGTAVSAVHQLQASSVNGLPAGQATCSFVVKRSGTGTGSRYITLIHASGSVGFDLQSGIQTTTSGSVTGGIEHLANMSLRVWITYTHVAGGSAPMLALRSSFGTGSQTFTGTGSDGILAGFAQLEAGSISSYIPARFSGFTPILGFRPADTVDPSFPVLASSEAIRPGVANAEWSPEQSYSINNEVTYQGIAYKSLLNGNFANDPPSNPSWWLRLGAANAWAMFDELLSSTTQATGQLDVAFLLNGASCIVLMGLSGVYRIKVLLSAGPGQAIGWTSSIQPSQIFGLAQVVIDLPSGYSLAEVQLEAAATSATLQVGNIVWGTAQSLGSVRYGARSGIRDYSRKETNEFGEALFVKRAFAKTLSCTLEVEKADLATVQTTLESLRATPAMWIGAPDDAYSQTLNVYGFYKDFYLSVDYPTKCLCALELEGLI